MPHALNKNEHLFLGNANVLVKLTLLKVMIYWSEKKWNSKVHPIHFSFNLASTKLQTTFTLYFYFTCLLITINPRDMVILFACH
jgi:hypothetical protein